MSISKQLRTPAGQTHAEPSGRVATDGPFLTRECPLRQPADLAKIPHLDHAIAAAVTWLRGRRRDEGYWVAPLQSNSCMEAQWVLAMHVLGVRNDPKYDGVIRAILAEQRADGSWEVYRGAPDGDVNTTVECYAALRCAGFSVDAEPIVKAREWIFASGALARVRVFTRYWLALIGEWPWETIPAVPPELILLPKWAPLNIYRFASWARGTMVPIAVLSARRPVHPLPSERRLDELFPGGRRAFDFHFRRRSRWFSWETLFFAADQASRAYSRFSWQPGRDAAIRLCLEWILKHQEADGAWSGIQPPWIYSLMALAEEGYPLDHPVMRAGLDAFDAHWSYERDGAIYLQASESPVWDTLLSLLAILETDPPAVDDAILESLEWILEKQGDYRGDWAIRDPHLQPGGWPFERANRFYPDIDDTAMGILVLARLRRGLSRHPETAARVEAAIQSASEWLRGMQSSDGGWAAFDRDNTSALVTKIPFCDFGEVLDPPSVDVTAHAVEALAATGTEKDDPAVAAALTYILREQETDGSWFGRWGVNYLYGTGAVLPALSAVGFDGDRPEIQKAAWWIVKHQNDDGGWGETCASYMDDSLRGTGPSTASQTGWALMGLLATGSHRYDTAIRRGVDYLQRTQVEGTWDEPEYTGTGFPGYALGRKVALDRAGATLEQGRELARGFMLNYNLYRHYFPLIALGRARRHFIREC